MKKKTNKGVNNFLRTKKLIRECLKKKEEI